MSGLHGNKVQPGPNLYEEALRAEAGKVVTVYDADSFTAGIVTDQSLKNRVGSKLFKNVPVAHHVSVRSNTDITIKLNATTNPPIPIYGGMPFDLSWIEVVDIFLTATAVANPMDVLTG